jgi:GT2 family glycosyltransferase
MSRPEVSVVMPFAGTAEEAAAAIESLLSLDIGPGDELILADNSGTVPAGAGGRRVTIVPAPGERSPAHARNVGAGHASREWILFLDADCRPLGQLLEAYFAHPVAQDVGALAGGLVPAAGADGLVARYGAARNFLSPDAHLRHPFMPRAAAANLLVRRSAFEQVGGFYEGIRAAEDTDFTWRLQRAGWRLELAAQAQVEHRYRTSLREMRRQWRGYAAGRAWLGRRYEGFSPEPAVVRGLERAGRRVGERRLRRRSADARSTPAPDRRPPFLALDALLALDELAGFALSNRPVTTSAAAPADVVLVADRFPGRGDPLVELAQAVGRARVEAAARPDVPDLNAVRDLNVRYLEDDGAAARVAAGLRLLIRHPVLVSRDRFRASPGEPTTWALAPAVRRLGRDPGARVHPLGGQLSRLTAERIARLAGRQLEE